MKLKASNITLILVMILFSYGKSQTQEKEIYKHIKAVVGNMEQPVHEHDQKITFLNTNNILQGKDTEILQIMIIRHQKVKLQKQNNYSFREAMKYFEAYDSAQIFPLDYSPINLGNDEIDTIFTSTLSRSIETAKAVFGDSIPLSNLEFFNEYNKDLPPIPVIKFPLAFWKIISTAEWILGLKSTTNESFKQGKQQAKMAGRFLEIKTGNEEKTILVGHGFINYFIKKYLKKNGWKMIVNGKNKNLGVTLFIKVKHPASD